MTAGPAPHRRILALAPLLLCAAAAGATAPTGAFSIRDFGAKGDGRTLDTAAINQAILAADAGGGGTVLVPAGTYLSSSIRLRSNLTLYLAPGATIEAADPGAAPYDPPEPNEWGDKFHYQDYGHSHWQNSLIWGIGLHDVSIVGPGLIHGKGLNSGLEILTGLYKDGGPGNGNKAISLRDCRNVTLRDFSILHGGHFGILATGVANLMIDNLRIDTNRDGIDIDCCLDVHVAHCSVNSPWDDGICLKASYGLGSLRPCSNITISDCYLTGGYDEGTLLDGTFKRSEPSYKSHHMGRIKLGTESNGDFKNIAIANCVFDDCMGIAIESVDGSHIEDVAISNITMRRVAGSPIFIRLGNRARGPGSPPVGTIRRVSIDNLVASGADWRYGSIVSGIPGHPVEDLRLSNIRIEQEGGGGADLAGSAPPEAESKYPEPTMFGTMPSYGFFLRHVSGVEMNHVELGFASPEARPALVLVDVAGARLDHVDAMRGAAAALFDLRRVSGFSATECAGVADTRQQGPVEAARY